MFRDAFNFMKSGTLLRQVVNKIQEAIDFNDSKSRHLFGDVYEQVLRDLQSAGNAGEYYTPRAVTQFAVDMIDPKLGEKILDPACGTGGFLTGSIEHIRRNEVKTAKQEKELHRCIHGVEKKPLPHLLCTTNMIVHGIDVPSGIRHDNTLTRPLRDYGPWAFWTFGPAALLISILIAGLVINSMCRRWRARRSDPDFHDHVTCLVTTIGLATIGEILLIVIMA